MTNNGWTYSLAKHIHEASHDTIEMAAMCMYRFKPGTNRSDPGQYYNTNNVVPHANLDPHDNPDGMWWRESLFGKMASFLNGSTVVLSRKIWDRTKEDCVGLSFGPFAFGIGSWLNKAVLPGVTPSAASLGPDGLQRLLNFDDRVRTPCHMPLVRSVFERFVDCSAITSEQRSDGAGETYLQI